MILHLGKKIAPPRFLLFAAVFVAGLLLAIPPLGWGRGTMAAFDVAAIVFLIAVSTLLKRNEADKMREAAERNDANRAGLLALSAVVIIAVLAAVAAELRAPGQLTAGATTLIVVTLVIAWLFANTVFALHYAHIYYLADDSGGDGGGLDVPETKEPDYWDFIYFAFTLGMTFQTSDVQITARGVRKIATLHSLLAFVFNLGVVAFTINVLGG